MNSRLFLELAAAIVMATLLSGCKKEEKEFQAKVRIEHLETVETDDAGKAISTDADLVFHTCPGLQRATVRSGKAFSECIRKKAKAGDEVDAKLHWEWDEHGHFDFHTVELAGCPLPIVDDDDSSWVSAAACEPSIQHDAVVGFHCDLVGDHDKSGLFEKCPWFRRE